ncbi:LytR/AlgR family response regulator transcription factor [Jiulongibacter sp. NS-SX5]|uniref:LytR/AlgR family response regulator transcription factor n=1 Tax=Jiulongibacter sp. NS-SX5 TaxID=3463854 RepID=UPI004059C16F
MNNTIKLVGKKHVRPNDIVLLKADANYTEVMLRGGEQVIVSKTLKEMEKVFDKFSSFFRVHKSFMVNLDHVEGVQRNGVKTKVRLADNFDADISRRKKDAFLSVMRQRRAVI